MLIENGVLKNYMIDRLNGRRMGMPPTGSARRESYAYAPTSRMRNTYIAAGSDDEKEIISSMGDGCTPPGWAAGPSIPPRRIQLRRAGGVSGKRRQDHHARARREPIGKGADILMKIDRVGRDMRMAQGMCGSLSGSVPTNVGQPMIRVSSITVGGRA